VLSLEGDPQLPFLLGNFSLMPFETLRKGAEGSGRAAFDVDFVVETQPKILTRRSSGSRLASSPRSVTIGKPNGLTSPWEPDDPPLKLEIYRRTVALSGSGATRGLFAGSATGIPDGAWAAYAAAWSMSMPQETTANPRRPRA
jgi:hypothetical protein